MSTLIHRPFSFTRDFRSILWGATLQYNFLGSACAGIVVAAFVICALMSQAASQPGGQGPPLFVILLLPLFWPLTYFLVFFPVSIVLAKLSDLMPALAFVALCYALMFVAIGDPIVYVLRRLAPRVVPVERPAIFSVRPIYWVLKPEAYLSAALAR